MYEQAQKSFWLIVISCLGLCLVAAWASVGVTS